MVWHLGFVLEKYLDLYWASDMDIDLDFFWNVDQM